MTEQIAEAIDPKDRVRSLRDLAQWYHDLQPDPPNLVPLDDTKRPTVVRIWNGSPIRIKWQEWQSVAQTDRHWKEMRGGAYWGESCGIALVNGFNGWVNFDFDSKHKNDPSIPPIPRTVAEEMLVALGLPSDYPWLVASPTGGWHIYAIVDTLEIDKGKLDRLHTHETVDHVELRYKGHYTALPGSLHPNGKLYAWANARPTSSPAHISGKTLLAAYLDLTYEKSKPAAPARSGPSSAASNTPYVAKAVADELAKVAQAPAGSRNDTLNHAAFALGTLVGAGALSEGDAEAQLLSAALSNGLTEGEALATIKSGLSSGIQNPRTIPESAQSQSALNDWIPDLFFANVPDDFDFDDATVTVAAPKPPHLTWPYSIDEGRLVYQSLDKAGDINSRPIADFYAVSVEEIQDEDAGKFFVLEGKAIRGGFFRVEVPADVLGDDRALRKLLSASAGSLDGVYARQGEHLRPAIQKCSPSSIIRLQRFRRTGWADGHFLMPGRDQRGRILSLDSRKLPYGFTDEGDLDAGLVALDHLLQSVGPQYTTPILSQLLLAPLRRCVSKFMARPGLFVEGRTGSFKTTVVQTFMALYGPRFLQDDALLKWGEGATRNAILSIAAIAQDLPVLVDNYKPNTGEGPKAFTNLVHNISEGTDRVRLDSRAELRPTKALHCLPIYTGEDIPDNDSATLARLLLVRFPRQDGGYNAHLAAAHESAEHLQTIGMAWLEWLEDEVHRKAASTLALQVWAETYEKWRVLVLNAQQNVANAPRIITNLTMHDLTWRIASLCPTLAPLLDDYALHHDGALQTIATSMAGRTTDAVDASHFLSALRELLTSGGAVLMDRRTVQEPKADERDRMIGWKDEQGVYLLSELAVAAARRLLGQGSIPVSNQALFSQLEGLGAIADKGKDHTAKVIKVGGKSKRVVHLVASALDIEVEAQPEEAGF